jgi:putative ABC transport system permease protein
MTLLHIVAKNLKRRLLGTSLTLISLTAGLTLFLSVDAVRAISEAGMRTTSAAFDLIFAARGSALQTVLNSLFHLETSTGVIPYAVYETAKNDGRVAFAVPFYVGDQYRGFRMVGTSPEYLSQGTAGKNQTFRLAVGELFDDVMEAVAGADAARILNLKLGDTIEPEHGVLETGGETMLHEHAAVRITGILQPTGTPADRVIFTDVRSLEFAHRPDLAGETENHDDHDHAEGEEHAHEHPAKNLVPKQLDAVLVKMKNPAAALQIAGVVNYPVPENPLLAMNARRDPFFAFKPGVMAVIPAAEIAKLMQIVGRADQVLRLISTMVIIIALIGMMVGMYNTMNERREELAVMRALGAKRLVITSIILLEAGVLSFAAGLLSLATLQLVLFALKPWLAVQAGLWLTLPYLPTGFFWYAVLFALAGMFAGIIPAMKAYFVDPVTALSGEA